MKKLLVLFSSALMTGVFAQCTISGPSNLPVGSTATYSVDIDDAQCSNCHLWESHGSVASISPNAKKRAVRVTGNSNGNMTLSLAMLTPKGVSQCNKTIAVGNYATSGAAATTISRDRSEYSTTNAANCNSDFTNYSEMRKSDGIVAFVPSTTNADYKYYWETTYANGEVRTSNDTTPNFSYSKENGISSVKVRITSPNCISNFTKSYNATYWVTF
ncbi:hypothetical protein [Chryseobacterium koreense]|uniref:hypothetical protein n=1 Tax=Chryseobacterium koreense TaxID=232216 RepID=UPI0026EA40E6|nr:hypothetical protein [Chryseobacterium koreense]